MATNTYVALATQTLGSSAASVTFSSIPSGYTDLVLVINPIVTSATTFSMRYNGVSTGTPYSFTDLYGDGSSAGSYRLASQNEIRISYAATNRTTNAGNIIVNVMNYSNATTYKTNLTRASVASDGVEATVGLWRSTAAINQIEIIANSGGSIIAAGSTFTIYGLLASN
jgi:hypothetical protein